jgi:hypothetical protein
MGVMGLFWFGEKDKLIIEEIAKAHKLDVKEVELAYKKMVESLKKEK